MAALSHDTGTSSSDGLTADATVSGTLTAAAGVATFTAGLDSGAATFDISADLQPNGSFTITPAQLAQIAGQAVTDGSHTLHLKAQDTAGQGTTLDVAFTLDTTPPTLTAALSHDTGASATDGITKDPSIGGNVGDANGLAALTAGLDAGAATVDISADLSNGVLTLSPAILTQIAGSSLADGAHTLHLQATDKAGNVAKFDAPFTLLTATPAAPTQLHLTPQTDTGVSTTDGITNNTSPVVAGSAPAGDLVQVLQAGNVVGSGTADTTGAWTAPLSNLQPGNYSFTAQAVDVAGNVSAISTSLGVVIDTTPPATPTFDLAAGTADLGAESTSASVVTLVGHTEPGVTVSLVGTSQHVLATGGGAFQIPQVSLASGANTLMVQASDVAGNTSTATLAVTSTPSNQPNAVLVWNQAALNAIQSDGTDPVLSTRTLAMVQSAVFDAVNNIAGTPTYYVKVAAPAGASAPAAVDMAAHAVLTSLYPAQQATFDSLLNTQLAQLPTGQATMDGETVGQAVGNAIVAMRANDGAKAFIAFTPGTAPGDWQPTAPMFAPALDPQAANMTPWAMTSPNQFDPAGPPPLNSAQWAQAVNQVESLGLVNSTTRTADQTKLAQFWNDGLGTPTPSGHWNAIAQTVAQQQGESLADDARLFAELDITLADAGIAAWNTKYQFDTWRPITVIRGGADGVNPAVTADPTWTPLLTTPNFPEYISGHSTYSAAAATVLDAFFGPNVTFTTTEPTTTLSETYTSFDQAAQDAGMSRIYGGIHFMFSNLDGQATGKNVANFDLATFNLTKDTTPPKITLSTTLPSGASKSNVTINGTVTDNLSGVAQLQVQVDGGAFAPVSFNATTGAFAFPTSFALDGSADGKHVINFQATDNAGNVSPLLPFTFTLGTLAPTLTVNGVSNNGNLTPGTTVTGTATGGGATIVALSYAFDNGPSMPIAVNADGSFSQRLNLSALGPGAHTLAITTTDAAGNSTTVTFNLTLAAAIPLTISSVAPTVGSSDVSVTFRPVVNFSRPIDKTTLTGSNFFATDSSGAVIPATIVPADDGLSAQLFFTNPLPSSSSITLKVKGATIKAADGSVLDAADNGTPGSTRTDTFTTVSNAPVPGTSIHGIVADAGPDGQMGTRDDVRAGPDGVLGTADDIYLLPIAGATVYILGQQNQAVISGSDGSFNLTSVPAGDVKLVIDGRTATNAPSGVFYPEMVFDLTIQPGVANTVMGTMGTTQEQAAMGTALGAYLPRLQTSILQSAGGNTATTIALAPDAAIDTLTAQQASEYSITVAPNSLIGMNGQRMSSGMVGVSTVSPSLIRGMLPQGVMQLATTLTIQAPGVATFSTPLQITFANVYGAAPGSKLDVYSFNHTTGMLEITGTATVSADGLTVTTDPDSGVTHPGWFGVTPPGDCGGDGGNPTPNPEPSPDSAGPPPPLSPIVQSMLTGEDGTFQPTSAGGLPGVTADANGLTFNAPDPPPDQQTPPDPQPGCPPQEPPPPPDDPYRIFFVEVDGPITDYMKSTGDVNLAGDTVILSAGDSPRHLSGQALKYDDMFQSFFGLFGGGLASINTNILYGSQIKITEIDHKSDGSETTTIQPFDLYRLIDATDAEPNDGIISFEKTLDDGKVERDKPLEIRSGATALPTISYSGSKGFGVKGGGNEYTLTFMPNDQGERSDKLTMQTPEGADIPDPIMVLGNGIPQEHIFLDTSALTTELAAIYNGTDPFETRAEQAKLESFLTPANPNLATPADYNALAASVVTQTMALFAPFSEGITQAGSATQDNTIDVLYTTTRKNGLFGTASPAPGGIDNLADIRSALNMKSANNQQAQNYMLAQAINEKTLDAPYNYHVEIYPRNILDYVTTQAQFINFLTKDSGHEPGHSLGLLHTTVGDQSVSTGGFLGIGATTGDTDVLGQGATQSSLDGTARFQPGLTLEPLKLAFGLPWQQSDVDSAYSYYTKTVGLAVASGQLDDGTGNVDSDNPSNPGPHLAILSTQTGNPIQSHFDFGTVALDPSGTAPSTTSVTLVNQGSDKVTLNSVALTSGSTFFSVSGVNPGTVLQPGQNVPLQIAFDPAAVGSASANLKIDSNDPNSPVNIALTGFGQSVAPAAQLSIVNNNLGGAAIGHSVQSSSVATITNNGTQPLVLSSFQVEAGGSSFTLTGIPANLASNPISLGFGQSFTFGVQYTAGQMGLERAKIDIATNDPNHPTLTLGVDGTGEVPGTIAHWGNNYVAIEFPNLNNATLRTVSDSGGHFSFFLSPNQQYHIAIFDPITGLIANGYGITPASGTGINLTTNLAFMPSTAKDNDGDGLPNDVEFAIGTNPNNAFTAGDGIDDFTHVITNQTNPTGLVPLQTGVVATQALQGNAEGIALAGSLQSPTGLTAYVATGSAGLAIVDVSHFQTPMVLGQLSLPGFDSQAVAIDPQLEIAAVASGSALNLVDVSTPTNPTLIKSISMSATAVQIADGVAYVASGNSVVAIDLLTGTQLAQESFAENSVDDLAIDQGNLYVLGSTITEPHTVYKIVLNGFSLPNPSEMLSVTGHPTFGRMHLFAANGLIYVGASDNNEQQEIPGIEIIQDDGSKLTLVGPSSGITAFSAAANGSGLALFTGGLQQSATVGLLSVSDPTNTGNVITTFNTPGTANAVAIADGLGFVADGSAGLAILNYLPFDTKGVAPTTSIRLPASAIVGMNGSTPEVVEGSTLPILVNAADDVQVRNVELLVNGQVVQNAVSAPYNLSIIAPAITPSSNTITIQVRVTDTGGNVALSNLLMVQMVPDTSAPTITNIAPANNSSQLEGAVNVQVTFSKPMAASTVTPANIQLRDSNGNPVTPAKIELRAGGHVVEINYTSVLAGAYQILLNGAAITDTAGNPVGSSNVPIPSSLTLTPRGTISSNISDVDPNTPGVQILEGTTVPLTVTVDPSVKVQSVTLLLNGQSMGPATAGQPAPDGSSVFTGSIIAPLLSAGSNTANFQAKITDTNGSTTVSNVLSLGLERDTTPPTLVGTSPANGGNGFAGVQPITITFSKPLAKASVSTANFSLVFAGADNTLGTSDDQTIPITGIQFLNDDKVVELTTGSLAVGQYQLTIQESGITDRPGNALGTGSASSTFTLQNVAANPAFLPFGTAIPAGDDDTHDIGPMPFPFQYFGQAVSGDIIVSSNGNVQFGQQPVGSAFDNFALPNNNQVFAAPFFDDIDPGVRGQVGFFETSSVLVITWSNVPYFGRSNTAVNFQIAFFSNGLIQMRYGAMSSPPGGSVDSGASVNTATIGLTSGNAAAVPSLGHIANQPNTAVSDAGGIVDATGLAALTAVSGNNILVFAPDGAGNYTITLDPVRSDAKATDDSAMTTSGMGVKIPVLANDTDPDNDGPYVASVTQPTNGNVVINSDNTVTYTANSGFVGTDTFTYAAADGGAGTSTATVTVTVGAPQLLAGQAVLPSSATADLTPAELQPVVTQAITNLATAGYNVSDLGRVQFVIASLPDTLLGMTYQDTIWLNANAAGHGWYTDASSAAFAQDAGAAESQALPGSPAFGAVDLLTVVTHEFGHELGLADIEPTVQNDDWMTATLGTGVRRLPDPAGGTGSWPTSLQGAAPAAASAPVTAGDVSPQVKERVALDAVFAKLPTDGSAAAPSDIEPDPTAALDAVFADLAPNASGQRGTA